MTTSLLNLPKIRSKAIMDSARGEPCSLRIASFVPGGRCADTDTTVGAHLPVFGKGMSTKVTDLAVVYSCSACHDIIDGRDPKSWRYIVENYPAAVVDRMLNGLVETQARLVEAGIIEVKGGKIE